MAKIELRYRDYKDPKKRGTWMLVDGKQVQRISSRQLTESEIIAWRKKHILAENGYLQKDASTFRRQEADDHIKEVQLGDLNDVVIDVNKDPKTGKWEKEGKEDYDYLDPNDPDQLEKTIEHPKPQKQQNQPTIIQTNPTP